MEKGEVMLGNMRDSHLILIGLVASLIALVVVAAITNGQGSDAETQKALSYAVIGLVGGLGGAARRES